MFSRRIMVPKILKPLMIFCFKAFAYLGLKRSMVH